MSTDGGEEQYTDRHLIRRLLSQARPQWGPLSVLLLLDLVAAPLYLLSPVPLKLAIDSVIGDDPVPSFLDPILPDVATSSTTSLLIAVAVLQVGIVLLIQLRQLSVSVLQKRTGQKLTIDLRARLFRHIQRLSFSFLDSRGTADSIYRVQYDTPAIEWLTIHGLIPIIGAAFTLGSMILVLARINLAMAVIGLAVAPVIILMMAGYRAKMRPHYARAKELESSALHVVQETLGAFRVVKAFGREEEHGKRFHEQSSEAMRAQVLLAAAEGTYGLAVQMTTGIGTALVLFIGARAVVAGSMTVGTLTLVMSYLAQLFSPIQVMSKTAASLQGYLESTRRVSEVLDRSPEVVERPGARSMGRSAGRIETRGLAFSYDTGEPVLEDVDLAVAPGSRVGVFGPTGAGKTTLVSLLMRIYDVDHGSVLLDGIDLRDVRLDDLRDQFGVVLQDSVLFSTSIAENIAYGRPGASEQEVVDAARAAGAHDFVSSLPEGYETVVGERGMRLSGGERQRIALARAFLKDAPILVLDEPTSSVDVQTEAAIMETMTELMKGRTTFMIAHRLSTLAVCDTLIHVDGGTAKRVTHSAISELAATTAGDAPTPIAGSGPIHASRPPEAERGDPVPAIQAVLAGAGYQGEIIVNEQRPDMYPARTDAQQAECRVAGNDLLLRCVPALLSPNERGSESYEVHVHRRILEGTELSVPGLLGTYHDAANRTLWAIYDLPTNSWRLDQLATVDAIETATRWLAAFHRTHEFVLAAEMPDLRRTRLDEYVSVTSAVMHGSRYPDCIRTIARQFTREAPDLLAPPLTATVGAAYPANFLVTDGHAYPVYFGEAALAAGEVDLTKLLEGWPADVLQRCERTYRTARWPDGPAPGFRQRLRLARTYHQLAWLAEHDTQTIPTWRLDDLHGRRKTS